MFMFSKRPLLDSSITECQYKMADEIRKEQSTVQAELQQ